LTCPSTELTTTTGRRDRLWWSKLEMDSTNSAWRSIVAAQAGQQRIDEAETQPATHSS
jgi:hypothetical protein